VEQLRRQLAADVERGQAGALGAGADQLRAADPGDRLLDAERAQRLDADQRILAAADGDQGVGAEVEYSCSLPFKGVRASACGPLVRARPNARRLCLRAGRAGVGMVFPGSSTNRGITSVNTIPTQPSP